MMTRRHPSNIVYSARLKLGLTQIALAERLGVSRQTIWRYERGENVPKSVQLALEAMIAEHDSKKETTP